MLKTGSTPQTHHNSGYTLRSSLPLIVAVLGLRYNLSAPAFGLFSSEKTSHSGETLCEMLGNKMIEYKGDNYESSNI